MNNDFLSGLFNLNSQMMTLLIGILIIGLIVRSLFRMIMPVVVIGLVMVVFLGQSPDDVINTGKRFASLGTNFIQNSILPLLNSKDSNDSLDTPSERKPYTKEELEKFFNENEENTIMETFEGH